MGDDKLRERAEKDIDKLEKALGKARELFVNKYEEVLSWAENYLKDALYYYKKEDYFTSFGAANYAYGMLDAIFIIEGIKERLYEEEGI